MTYQRIFFFSDLHLSARFPKSTQNWEICLKIIEEEQPDFVVLGGDFLVDDPDDDIDRQYAVEQISRITRPWRAVPGNHDIGDSPPRAYLDQVVTEKRLKKYISAFGKDYWAEQVGPWRCIGLNAITLGSGLASEQGQVTWLKELFENDPVTPTLVFLHKPLILDSFSESAVDQTTLNQRGRELLLKVFKGRNVKAVFSGHLHTPNSIMGPDFSMVWAPSACQAYEFGGITKKQSTSLHQSVGWVQIVIGDETLEWHVRNDGLDTFDISKLIEEYGSLRFVPDNPLQPRLLRAK